jgi:hypothetical protein
VVSSNSRLSLSPDASWGALSPLVDRPFLQHLVEAVVGQGVREIDFILPEKDRFITGALGNGTRWGARFRYYSAAGSAGVYDAFQQLPFKDIDERILLAHSDRLPLVRLDKATSATTLFCWREEQLYWTGWGLVRAADMLLVPEGIQEQGLLAFFMKSGTDVVCLEGGRPLTARSYVDLLESNRRVLAKEFPGLLLGGKEVQPGVWMARNVKVHPTARVAPPAFLGENCRIGALAQVGPAASIGRDCMIERETHVADSVIYGGSYVGRQLALRGVVVDRSRLVSTRCGAEIEGVDDLLLGSVFGVSLKTRAIWVCHRVAAAAALIFCVPFLAAMLLGSAFGVLPAPRKRSIVRTPTVLEPYRWRTFALWSFGDETIPAGQEGWIRHFFFCLMPALLPLAAGYLSLGGTKPRTREELEILPPAKRSVCLRSRSGVLPVLPDAPETDPIGVEIQSPGWREALALITGYATRVFRNCLFGILPVAQRRKAE